MIFELHVSILHLLLFILSVSKKQLFTFELNHYANHVRLGAVGKTCAIYKNETSTGQYSKGATMNRYGKLSFIIDEFSLPMSLTHLNITIYILSYLKGFIKS